MSEDSIFGTPPEPSNEAEQQAEKDWTESAPDPVDSKEMDSWSDEDREIYYGQGGQEP